MGLLEKIKPKKKDHSVGKLTMKACMLGPRGVGKTSVLTSMYSNMNEATKETNLFIKTDSTTNSTLKNKEETLKEMFGKNDGSLPETLPPGIDASYEETTFNFDLGLASQNINIGLEIIDYPGEYLFKKPDVVKKYINDSNAVIIAIDTPHLMEENGDFNEVMNHTELIKNFFKDTINQDCNDKLVMLVPLKCEKYFKERRINEVTDKVKKEYGELISFLRDKENKNSLNGKFAMLIAPIKTLGDIEFDDFDRDEDENKKVKTVEVDNEIFPQKAKYKYASRSAKYMPEYCEQPLLYLISFVLRQYENIKKSQQVSGKLSSFLKQMQDIFAPTPKSDELMKELGSLMIKKIDNKDVFQVLFGKGKIR